VAASQSLQRIVGCDVARAIAISGMIVHHFVIVSAADQHRPEWLMRVTSLLDGRPAALFLILAGIGITLRSHRAIALDRAKIEETSWILWKRGWILLLFGFLNLLVWPGDILRVYGVSLLLASKLIVASNRRLIYVSAFFAIGFALLLFLLDYEQNWDWSTMTYLHLWTTGGMLRNLFYDGFRAVFPWSGFLFFGMWLGRYDLRDRATRMRCMLIGFTVMLVAESVSAICVGRLLSESNLQPERRDELIAMFGTTSMPPLPLFLSAAGGLAVGMIGVSIGVAERFPHSIVVRSLSATGQMSLTWYFAHLYFGLGMLVLFQAIGNKSIEFGIASGSGFFLFAMLASLFWRNRFQYGPLEWGFRKLSSKSAS
jgi:uncharacterized protein